MKFRGRIVSVMLVRQFAQLLQTLSKCSGKAVMRLTHEKIYFIIKESEAKNKSAAVWCEMPVDAIFGEYAMEGYSKPSDDILLEVNLEMMAARIGNLKSSNSVSSLKVKLTHKVMPCLTFEIESDTMRSKTVCLHDIPVSVISKTQWKEFEEPDVPEFDINVSMPDIKLVRNSLDRIRSCGSRAIVTANSEGWLQIAMDKFTVKSAVKFKDLQVLKYNEETDETGDENTRNSRKRSRVLPPPDITDEAPRAYNVEVDTKSLLQLIHTDDQKPDNCLCSIYDGRLLHLFYVYGEVMVKYSLPGLT